MTLSKFAERFGEFNLVALYSEGFYLGTDWLRTFCKSCVLANSIFEKLVWNESKKLFEIYIK